MRRCSPRSSSAAEVGKPAAPAQGELAHTAAISPRTASSARRARLSTSSALDARGDQASSRASSARSPSPTASSSRATSSSARRRSGAAAPFAAPVARKLERTLERWPLVARRRLLHCRRHVPEAAAEPHGAAGQGQRAEQQRDGERLRPEPRRHRRKLGLARAPADRLDVRRRDTRGDDHGRPVDDVASDARVVLERGTARDPTGSGRSRARPPARSPRAGTEACSGSVTWAVPPSTCRSTTGLAGHLVGAEVGLEADRAGIDDRRVHDDVRRRDDGRPERDHVGLDRSR